MTNEAAAADQVFSDLRVVDLSRWVAGEFATKLFADFGADVVKVERPGVGSLTRAWGPFPGDAPDPERSALFLHLNTSKRSVALDLTRPDDRRVLLDLVADADAVVESFRPGALERLGLGPDVLARLNPTLVLTRISPFGQTGPYRDREASGLVLQATGGPMSATGDAHRAPQRKPGNLEQYSIGRHAAHATLAGLIHARRTGTGCVLDVSGQEALLSSGDRRAAYLLAAAYAATNAPRGVRSAHRGQSKLTGPFRTRDGYVMLYVTNQAFSDRLVDLVGEDEPDFRERYHGVEVTRADWADFTGRLQAWFARQDKVDLMTEAQRRRIPLTAFLELHELLGHPHFRARGSFVTVEHPVAGPLEHIGAPWRMAGGHRLRRPAPRLDEHGAQLRAESARPRRPVDADGWPVAGAGPLGGIRVVDLTVVWAGPGGTALLGDLGAEVIRLEGNNRIARQASAGLTREQLAVTGYRAAMFPDRDPRPRPYDRSAIFNWHSRNKLSACANLETPEGRQAALDLIAVSDVLIENNARRTLDKLGLGHEELLARHPRLVVVRMPPMGMSGPMSDYLGYGPNFNALVGIAAMDGYEGETPDTAGDNYHMDEATPPAVAFAVMAALWRRARTGLGGLVEFAQAENVMQDIGEFFLDRQLNDRNPPILGNTDPHALQDVFACAGVDRWVAVSVRDDADWAALRAVVAGTDPAAGDWLSLGDTAAGRREHSARLRARLAEWAAPQECEALVARLVAARVPVAEVMTELRLLDDPHLGDREWFVTRSHPAVGTHRYPGHPWRATGFSPVFGRPVPSFGEDNEYVYRCLLGYDAARYADLVARGLVSTEQYA
jgi:crotonobetainyl-CoA:carnitine CoA-transferase CaiB-like acyl-CoA transferase